MTDSKTPKELGEDGGIEVERLYPGYFMVEVPDEKCGGQSFFILDEGLLYRNTSSCEIVPARFGTSIEFTQRLVESNEEKADEHQCVVADSAQLKTKDFEKSLDRAAVDELVIEMQGYESPTPQPSLIELSKSTKGRKRKQPRLNREAEWRLRNRIEEDPSWVLFASRWDPNSRASALSS